MNVGEAIGFVFEDEEWPSKLLLGAAISLIPFFGGAALTGYAIEVLRNVRASRQTLLPRWDRLGGYVTDGVLLWVATLIYSIPLLLLACPIALAWIPPAVAGDNRDLAAALGGLAGVISLGFGCLSLLYALLLWLVTPVLQIRFAESGELGACLRFVEVRQFLLQHLGEIIIAQLLVWAAGLAITTVLGGIIGVLALLPICGWIVASLIGLLMVPVGAWLMLVAAHLYGQVGRASSAGTSVA